MSKILFFDGGGQVIDELIVMGCFFEDIGEVSD